ncbi:MAG: hypothetical protein H6703_03865 [Myxococcales bacterium]|nr:hypothetical protein [Myxococcales bacterium]MCB9541568.1 hypothetical protein [Myxococcales bacterium]MCB9552163.1 hypothetical protein [Myxococcales bacterium]
MSTGGLCCAVHPEAPAVAACVECGRLVCAVCRAVDVDGLSRCVECRAAPSPPDRPPQHALTAPPEPAADASEHLGPTPIPWERPEGGDIAAFFATAREALLGPTRYMGRVPWLRGELRTPLLFAVIAGVLGQLALIVQTAFFAPPAVAVGLAALPPGLALATAPLLPLVVTFALFLKAGAAHAMLRVAGAPPRPFEATFRVYAYAEVASLLLVVPWIGPYAARFYVVFLLLTGLRFAQAAGFSASLLAMAPTLLLMWVLV